LALALPLLLPLLVAHRDAAPRVADPPAERAVAVAPLQEQLARRLGLGERRLPPLGGHPRERHGPVEAHPRDHHAARGLLVRAGAHAAAAEDELLVAER